MNINVAITLSLAILFSSIGDILLSNGMKLNGEIKLRHIRDIIPLIRMVFSNRLILIGVLAMGIYFVAYTATLAWEDVSVANPLTALSYVIATAYALLVMHERVGLVRCTGVALVTLGAIFVGLSS